MWKLYVYSHTITLNVSRKKIFTVESSNATATNILLGLILTHNTLSSNFKVFKCRTDKTFAFISLSGS